MYWLYHGKHCNLFDRKFAKFVADNRFQKSEVDTMELTYALPEKTKRGPPTNKNMSVRNIQAQITNMSSNENAGFKNEYHVIFDFFIRF